MNENYNTPNSGCCGRPMAYAPENKCNYNDCCINEYPYKMKACIKNKQPDCEAQAVIPSITVETVDGITNLANCLVHVTSTNTTYYVDDKHRIMITWAGPVNIPGYDMEHNPNHFKNQIVTDTEAKIAAIYDNNGIGYVFGIEFGEVQEAVDNKINEMVESGELQRLVDVPATDSTIGGVIVKDGLSVASDGSISVKAGTGITVDENGVSETPYEDYLDISVHEYDYSYDETETTTHVVYSIIPAEYKPKIVMSDPNNPNTRKVSSDFDYMYKPTLMVNFGPWHTGTNEYTYGPLIVDSSIKVQNNLGEGDDWSRTTMGITADGELRSINGSVAANQINLPYACRVWRTLYNDGVVEPDIDGVTHNPRTIVAQDYDGNYLVAVCGGRTEGDTGMTGVDEVRFVMHDMNFNAKVIFNPDGGGSSNLLLHGIRQNKLVNGENRACPNWLVWSSPTAKHDGLFENQSINNQANIDYAVGDRADRRGVLLSRDYIAENFVTSDRVDAKAQCRVMFPNPRAVIYNLEFSITGEEELPANTKIFTNLPWTSGNYYVCGLNRSDNVMVPFMIRSENAGGVRFSSIENRVPLTPGKLYDFNQVFWLINDQY